MKMEDDIRRNYTIFERAIMVIGLQAGKTPFEINQLLIKEQKKLGLTERRVPASSFAMLKLKYLPNLNKEQLWDHIQNPKSVSEVLKK